MPPRLRIAGQKDGTAVFTKDAPTPLAVAVAGVRVAWAPTGLPAGRVRGYRHSQLQPRTAGRVRSMSDDDEGDGPPAAAAAAATAEPQPQPQPQPAADPHAVWLQAGGFRAVASHQISEQVRVLRKPPAERSEAELDLLAPLAEHIKFLYALHPVRCREVTRRLRSRVLPAGASIFEEEDPAEDLYLIMNGSVHYNSSDRDFENRTLREGAHFGDVEVSMGEGATRLFSAETEDEAILLLLSRADYSATCQAELEDAVVQKVWLLYEMPLFYSLSIDQLIEFSYICKLNHWNRGDVLARPFQRARQTHVLVAGEVRVTATVPGPVATGPEKTLTARLATLGRGSVAGSESVLSHHPTAAGVAPKLVYAYVIDTLTATTVSFDCDQLAMAIGHCPKMLDWLREYRGRQAPMEAVKKAAAVAISWQRSQGKLVERAAKSNIGDMPMQEGCVKIWNMRSPPPIADADADDKASLLAAERASLKHKYHRRIHSSWRIVRTEAAVAPEPEPEEVLLGWRAMEARKTARAKQEMAEIADLTATLEITVHIAEAVVSFCCSRGT